MAFRERDARDTAFGEVAKERIYGHERAKLDSVFIGVDQV